MKFADKIIRALKEQGRSQVWLADKLGIRPTSLNTKLKNNTFSVSNIFHISALLNIMEDE